MANTVENHIPIVRQTRGYYSNYPVYAPVADTGGQTINVKTAGAKGDGTTDDYASIMKAAASLPTSGGSLYFPKGKYVTNTLLQFRQHGIWLRGEGFSETFADQAADMPGLTGISVIQAGPNLNSSSPLIELGASGANIWTGGGLDGLLFQNLNATTGDGVVIYNQQHARLTNCGLKGFSRGVYVQSDQSGGISNVDIQNNLIYGITGTAIYLDSGSQENYLRFNYIAGASGRAVFVGGTGNTLLQNHIETVTAGSSGLYRKGTSIYVAGQQSFILGNDTLTSDCDAIYCSASKTTIIGNTLRNPNALSIADGSGIFLEGSITAVIVTGNNMSDGNSRMAYGIYDGSSTDNGVLIAANQSTGHTIAAQFSAGHQAAFATLAKTGAGLLVPTAYMDTAASTTAAASLRVRSGVAPTSPNDGDIWYDGTNIKIRVGSTTKTFTLT